MQIPFVDLKAQYNEIATEINDAIQDVLDQSAFIRGPAVYKFEEKFAKYLGAKYCIGVGNGTDALSIALKCLGIGDGDEVITVANSFIATSEAISMTGAKVVFVDCLEDTYNINTDAIEQKINENTKAIIPVALYGQSADIDRIKAIAQRYSVHIIEDAAQAHGALYNGRKVGTIGDIGCFSFYPGKNLGAYGDAGAIVTNNDELAEKIRMYANHGRKEKYKHKFEGINSRMDGIQGAILTVKLKYLDKWISKRRAIARFYAENLIDSIITPFESTNCYHVYHLYVVRVRNRDVIRTKLKDKGISTGIHYPVPLPLLNAYKYMGQYPEDFPVASPLANKILSLPIYPEMTEKQLEYVIKCTNEIVAG